MIPTADLCRAQESLHLAKAAGTSLENVRQVSIQAAKAWGKEALIADRREERHIRVRAESDASAARKADAANSDDLLPSENPDRGQAMDAPRARLSISIG
jgi:hypothetical protein